MRHGQKAWLVTWEWMGEHAVAEDHIAAIFRPRLSKNIITEIVESLYAIHIYWPEELAYWAKHPKENPYKAIWENNFCFCGHNPSLVATYVHDLIITKNHESGFDTISWKLPPIYHINQTTGQKELLRGELSKSITRNIIVPLSDREIGRFNADLCVEKSN